MQKAHGWKQRLVVTTLVSMFSIALVAITAAGQEGPSKPQPAKDGPKPLAFEFRDTPWEKVLDWLADNSGGVPIVSQIKPQGTFNFVSPAGKKYTLPQIIDILNQRLLGQKILIVRNTNMYNVVDNDQAQAIDTTLLPNITVDDLEMDKPYDQQKYGQTELLLVTFNLNSLTVDEAETNLTSSKGPFGRFQKVPKANMLMATDTASNLRRMKKLLDRIDPSGDTGNIEVFSLRNSVNGQSIETTIKGLFNLNPGQSSPVPNPPKIQYDEAQHKIIVTGDKAQLKLIRDTLTKLNALKTAPATTIEPGTKTATQGPVSAEDATRNVILKTGNASQYVDNLRYLLSSLRANPVFVIYEPLMTQSIEDARKGLKPKEVSDKDKKEDQLTDEKRPPVELQNKPGNPNKPVFIASMSRTNGVIIGSDDPEALDFAEQILTYLTKEGDEYYEIIPLKNSNAQTVRDTLDELINGKRQQGGNPFGMMMPFGGGGNMREAVTGPTVRLAADKRTNSILVRAPRQIVVTIRRFVETTLDVNNIDQKLQPKPHIVTLRHAYAADIVDVLKEVYREYIDSRGSGGMQPGMPFNPFMQQQQQAQPERSIRLSIAASKSDNSVILNCPDVLWPEVENLLVQLDKNNADNDREAKVINIGKADPQTLQKALETITGKGGSNNAQGASNDPLAAMRNAMMNRFGGMGGMGNFGGPGMGGGGNRMGGGGGRGPGGGGGGGRQGGGGPGGGGGRGGPGGGARGGNRYDQPPAILSQSSGGSDFFADRVKEDPRTQVTFDPVDSKSNFGIVQAQAQQPAQTQPPANRPQETKPAQPTTVRPGTILPDNEQDQPQKPRAPRGDVSFTVLPDGQILLIGDPEDIKLVEKILEELIKSAPSSETELRMFGLDHLDCVSAINKLSTIFAKYNPVVKVISASGTSPMPQGGAAGARPGGFGAGPGQGGFGQPGFGQGGFAQGGQGGQGVQPAQPSNLLMLAVPRQNSILIGGPKSAMEEIGRIIKLIDRPIDAESAPKIINLRRANASSLANTLLQFYQQRYTDEDARQNEIRIQPDIHLNSLLVHAGPADLKEIMTLVEFFDKSETKVVNEVRIKQLKNASAADLSTLLQQALSQALLGNTINTGTTGTGTGLPGQQGFNQPNLFGGQQAGAGALGGLNRPGGVAGTGTDRKGVSLTFTQPGKGRLETGLLDDVGIYADVRTNRLVISAPPESIAMLDRLIDELDVPPTLTADVKVFRLKNADATNALNTLQSVFTGQRTGTGAAGGGAGGLFGGANQQQQQLNFTANVGQGPQPIIPRFSVDARTNSLIIAAGRGDMILAEVILNNLDSALIRDRVFQVVRLKNNQAQNVQTNLQAFYQTEIQYLSLSELSNYTLTDREVTVIADNTNNSLIIGASQRFFPEVMRLIEQLDVELAQVAIQVLIAQVRLDNSDEFGVEVGLQSPILFDRSLFNPQPPAASGATTATNPNIGNPGFNWNNVSSTTQNNANNVSAGSIGMKGLTNYSTGLTNPTSGLGGFVFSAASNSVNVLVRALRTQGRIEVLSRPQIVTRDNQQALISVGQQVPIVTGSSLSNGILQNTVEQQQVGIILKVLPQISPDGRIVMRVEPQISKVSTSTVDIGNGVKGTIIDQTIASTTIDATDGKTVIIGGLITKEDDKTQRGIPWFGDLPIVGSLFRYRSQTKSKTELLIILTPHIIRNPMDAERVFMDESRKMSWTLDDVQAIHGAMPGAAFLQQGCQDNGLSPSAINVFENNWVNSPQKPQPADESLGKPRSTLANPNPGSNQPRTPNAQPPIGPVNPPVQQQQTPPWLLPPGNTPPMNPQYQQSPQYQGYQQPDGPVNNVVTGLPPQGGAMMNNTVPMGNGYPVPTQNQPYQQQSGPWKTTVTYGPAGNQPTMIQTQEVPLRQMTPTNNGFAGQQQP